MQLERVGCYPFTTKRKCKCANSFNGQYGMNPTGSYAHMFEEGKGNFIETTTEVLIKKK
jgi:hypothetical protein